MNEKTLTLAASKDYRINNSKGEVIKKQSFALTLNPPEHEQLNIFIFQMRSFAVLFTFLLLIVLSIASPLDLGYGEFGWEKLFNRKQEFKTVSVTDWSLVPRNGQMRQRKDLSIYFCYKMLSLIPIWQRCVHFSPYRRSVRLSWSKCVLGSQIWRNLWGQPSGPQVSDGHHQRPGIGQQRRNTLNWRSQIREKCNVKCLKI